MKGWEILAAMRLIGTILYSYQTLISGIFYYKYILPRPISLPATPQYEGSRNSGLLGHILPSIHALLVLFFASISLFCFYFSGTAPFQEYSTVQVPVVPHHAPFLLLPLRLEGYRAVLEYCTQVNRPAQDTVPAPAAPTRAHTDKYCTSSAHTGQMRTGEWRDNENRSTRS